VEARECIPSTNLWNFKVHIDIKHRFLFVD